MPQISLLARGAMTCRRAVTHTLGRRACIGLACAMILEVCYGSGRRPTTLAADAADRVVAAKVGETPVYADEVASTVATATQGRDATPQAAVVLQAQALETLIGRRLIETRLERDGLTAKDHEIDSAIDEMKSRLAQQKIELADLLKQRGLSEDALRREIAWEVSWKKYLASHINEEALEKAFAVHRLQLDGSEVGVSHILFRPVNNSSEALADVLRQATDVREQIAEGKLKFEDAARAYSIGPSREQGGDLGFIPRQGVMDEAFSKAAFELGVGEMSSPVRTRFGIHLIRVTKIKPGEKKWTDVREPLTAILAQQTFLELAKEERAGAEVQYTGATPYIKPGTQQLVLPMP